MRTAFCLLLSSAVAHAAPPVAKCGDSAIELIAGPDGARIRGLVVAGATRWAFTGSVGTARLGARTRTLTVEALETQDRKPAGRAPAGLFVDLLLDDKKLILRHASEGEPDVAYALDLAGCTFDGDAALAALVPPPSELVGCAPAVVKGGYLRQVTRVATLPDAEAEHEAERLCDDHQQTIAARARLEAAISDRAARARVTARGAALLRTEDARQQAWNRIDGCLAAAPGKAHGVAALHDAEARERACYAKIAARP